MSFFSTYNLRVKLLKTNPISGGVSFISVKVFESSKGARRRPVRGGVIHR